MPFLWTTFNPGERVRSNRTGALGTAVGASEGGAEVPRVAVEWDGREGTQELALPEDLERVRQPPPRWH